MTHRRRIIEVLGPAVVISCIAWSFALAEVATDARSTSARVPTLILSPASITDDADPIPQERVRWDLYRSATVATALNVTGAIRRDGPPALALKNDDGWPLVAWAYNNGTDHDIAIAEWTGSGWTAVHYLTARIEDELDPRVFVGDNGTIYIVWWVAGNDPHVMLSARGTDLSSFASSERISPVGEAVRRPTVARFQGSLRVAYEREIPGDPDSTEIVILRFQDTSDSFQLEHVLNVPRSEPLDPVLHVKGGHLWLDWKHGADQLGCSRFANSTWGNVEVHAWGDDSWVGEESGRREIRTSVLSSVAPSSTVP